MSGASDIAKLFEVAGGSPAQYQEVERAEQMEGARGRWSAHADTQPDPDQQDAEADNAQPLIAWSIAAVADEPPPVLPVAHEASAPAREHTVEAEVAAAVEAPVEPETQPVVAAQVAKALAIETAPAPVAAPQAAALSSVFARLMARNEPRADAAPRGKS
ncbi:BcsR/BcsP family cellulose biosynthesis protein [Paraburkholderia bannensis]|uniref:BcsR/BcsP family cellulose biosynthesis protein n=1 Tax=Paraburkholderia bannensis TaxID=765414 RepID=UPI0038BDE49D